MFPLFLSSSFFSGVSPFRSFICSLPRVSSFSLLSAVALDLYVHFVFGLFDFSVVFFSVVGFIYVYSTSFSPLSFVFFLNLCVLCLG